MYEQISKQNTSDTFIIHQGRRLLLLLFYNKNKKETIQNAKIIKLFVIKISPIHKPSDRRLTPRPLDRTRRPH
jgi:hypothetical protein